MDVSFTAYLWVNLILAGFFLGIGWQVAVAIYNGILWLLGQRRAQP